MWKPQVRYSTCADPENFLDLGGVTFRPVWVQLHTSGVVINLSKMGRSWHRFLLLVHSEARTRFDDIDKPQASNTWVTCTTVVFSINPRKNDGWAGNCFGSVRSSFVTLLSALCAFSQGSNLGFHVARLY